MDVVIVTLMRATLGNTIESVKNVIPDPNIILVKGKGTIGDLRNEGLRQCRSSLTCFADDDILLNADWFAKCMRVLQTHPEIIAVGGKTPIHHTLGCMIFRTKEFKKAQGFPKLDDRVLQKLGSKIMILEDAICEHQIKRGFGPLQHNLHFLCHGFQSDERAGWCYSPRKQLLMVYSFFRAGYPDYAIGSSVWLVKPIFVLPFVLEDLMDRKRRGGSSFGSA